MGGSGGLARRQHSSAIATPTSVLKSRQARQSSAVASATPSSSTSKGSHSRVEACRLYPAWLGLGLGLGSGSGSGLGSGFGFGFGFGFGLGLGLGLGLAKG